MSSVALTRRDLLRTAAAGTLALAGAGRSASAAAPARLGVQLYTVRDLIGKDPAGTLKAIAGIGYAEVEAVRATLDVAAPAARAAGLAVPSIHVDAPIITGNWTPYREAAKRFPMNLPPDGYDLARAIEDARTAGARFLVVPYLLPNERQAQAAYYTSLGTTLNRAGEQIRKAGLQLCYHNHGFEFEPFEDGRLPLDVLMSASDPELVKLELDVFWTALTGHDPVAWIEKYSGRVPLVHLKDKSATAPQMTQEMKVSPDAFKEVGSGALDFKAILAAARAAGVQHYFVEQDHTAGHPVDSLRKSYSYLRSL